MVFSKLKRVRIRGLIKYFNLINFWKDLSLEQQNYLRNKFNSGLGVNPKDLTDIEIKSTNQSKLSFLTTFLQSPKVDSDETLFSKIIVESESAILNCKNILDIHFYLQHIIIYNYRKRNNSVKFYNQAKESCYRQIDIAEKVKNVFLEKYGTPLPSHYGFKQYSIILEKEKKYEEALSTCIFAQKQGWNGDWEKRISRLKIKTTANNV